MADVKVDETALEAAAKAFWGIAWGNQQGVSWEASTSKDYYRRDARAAVTAYLASLPDTEGLRERVRVLEEAAQGILDDDDPGTSLADQRGRWEARMTALRHAVNNMKGSHE